MQPCDLVHVVRDQRALLVRMKQVACDVADAIRTQQHQRLLPLMKEQQSHAGALTQIQSIWMHGARVAATSPVEREISALVDECETLFTEVIGLQRENEATLSAYRQMAERQFHQQGSSGLPQTSYPSSPLEVAGNTSLCTEA